MLYIEKERQNILEVDLGDLKLVLKNKTSAEAPYSKNNTKADLNFFFQLSLPSNRIAPYRTSGGGEHDATPLATPNDPCVHVQDSFVLSVTAKNSRRRGTSVMGQSSTLPMKNLRPPTQTPARATHA